MKKVDFKKMNKTDKYAVMFDSRTGIEIVQGVNGYPDPFQLDFPSLMDIGIMGSCQNKCSFCYQGHSKEANMSLDQFKFVIDQVKNYTNQVALGGRGDPNHHENFKEIIEYCRESRVVPNYTTSGIDLTKEQVEISKLCGAVAVSDYEKHHTYAAINEFINAGIKTNIHLIFSNPSYEKSMEILFGMDPWRRMVNIDKLNAVIFLLYKPVGAARGDMKYKPSKTQRDVFLKKVLNPECKFKVGMDSCLANHLFSSDIELSPLQRMSLDSCEAARCSCYVSPSLKMTPCSFSDHPYYEIDLNKQELKYCWQDSVEFNNFRCELMKEPHKCPLRL